MSQLEKTFIITESYHLAMLQHLLNRMKESPKKSFTNLLELIIDEIKECPAK